MTVPQKLPIGIQEFAKLREGGYLYVDKTKYLVELIDRGSIYFMSRPRRFGKSLTISAFDALFSGRRELFDGLYAMEFLDRPGFAPSPVVRLDMSRTVTHRGLDELEESISEQMRENARRYGVEIGHSLPSILLSRLLEALAQKAGGAVVLVDEYDKPILDCLDNLEKAQVFRASLRSVYTQIKADDRYTKFVFVTGITKFTKTGVFSAMNNLKDISEKEEYAAMVGYTEEELRCYFAAHIERTAEKLGCSKEELLARIKSYYDGFSFDGTTRLYNPFSTLNFFDDAAFKNYWFESGSPSFLVNYVKTRGLEIEDFRGKEETDDFTAATEIELAKPSSFLFQSGYLTIRKKDDNLLTLDYPNMEVLSSVARLFMSGKYQNVESGILGSKFEKAMNGGDPAGAIIEAYRKVLAAIPYDIYEREEQKRGEAFYHALLLVLLWSSRIPTRAENHSYKGRSDVEIEWQNKIYIIELKTAEGADACVQAADSALEQIKAKGYADKYGHGKVTLLGLAVNKTERQVGAFRIANG